MLEGITRVGEGIMIILFIEEEKERGREGKGITSDVYVFEVSGSNKQNN